MKILKTPALTKSIFFLISSRVSSSFKHNASFVSRLPTIRRHKNTPMHSPSLHKLVQQPPRSGAPRSFTDFISSVENLGEPYFFISFYYQLITSSENNIFQTFPIIKQQEKTKQKKTKCTFNSAV